MRPLTVFFFCNFVDESTRAERRITTDSPAASRKVMNACLALRKAGARPIILSMGRGRVQGSNDFHGWTVRRIGSIPVVYAPFHKYRGASELLSMLAPAIFIFRRRRRRRSILLLYNRMAFGVIPMLVARFFGWPTVFDLEDGELLPYTNGQLSFHAKCVRFCRHLLNKVYDRCCQRAILASIGLEAFTSVRPTWPYYGSMNVDSYHMRETEDKIKILFSGTVTPLTGSTTLVEALKLVALEQPTIARLLIVHVTGFGDGMAELQNLATSCPKLELHVHGRISLTDFKDLLHNSNIGLSLKKVCSHYANTTFPSKVVEYAAAGLYVISTDISDVRRVLGKNAAYLVSDDPRELAGAICEAVALGPKEMEQRSRDLHNYISHNLSFEKTGRELVSFLEGTFKA